MLLWERISPSMVGKGGFAPVMRLSVVIGLGAGFLKLYQRSIRRSPSSLTIYLIKNRAKKLEMRGSRLTRYSAVLRFYGEFPRGGDGYEGDGSESEGRRAPLWT
jgi:hypothetical protein